MLNVLPGPSGMSVWENADPAWLNVAGVTRRTLLVQAALTFSCSVLQFAKFWKIDDDRRARYADQHNA